MKVARTLSGRKGGYTRYDLARGQRIDKLIATPSDCEELVGPQR